MLSVQARDECICVAGVSTIPRRKHALLVHSFFQPTMTSDNVAGIFFSFYEPVEQALDHHQVYTKDQYHRGGALFVDVVSV